MLVFSPLLEKPLPLSGGSWSLNGYWHCKQCAASVDIKWKWICVEVEMLLSGRTHAEHVQIPVPLS